MKYTLALLAGVALLAGCSKSEPAAETAAAGDAAAPAAAAAGGTGVAECDTYMSKVQACINDKVPEAQRGAVEQALNASKAQWAAVTDKNALAQACKMAMDQAKASYGAMGCTF